VVGDGPQEGRVGNAIALLGDGHGRIAVEQAAVSQDRCRQDGKGFFRQCLHLRQGQLFGSIVQKAGYFSRIGIAAVAVCQFAGRYCYTQYMGIAMRRQRFL